MKKRIISLMLVVALLLSLNVTAMAATTENTAITYRAIKINLNGREITPCDAAGKTVEPFIMNSNGTTYLPLRAIGQALGLNVAWDASTSTVSLTSGGEVITGAGAPGTTTGTQNVAITYRDIKVVLDGQQLELKNAAGATVEPFIMGGTTYLPLRVVGEALGLKVSWDGSTNTAYLGEDTSGITGITLNQSKIWFFPGDTYQLVATVSPENASDKSVTWTTSDASIATVSDTGLVTMVKPGTAVITAKTINGKTATCTVVVQTVAVTGIMLNTNSITLAVGGVYKLSAAVIPENATNKTITWTSSNPAVATVDATGNVKAVANGTTTVTASVGGFSATCAVTVGNASLTAEQIYAKCASAVFYIEVYDRNGTMLGSGSGVFISADGKALTNHHVVEDAYSAKIMTNDGKVYNVTGYYDAQESIDMALIQVAGSGFPYLTIGDSTKVATGQNIFAIGSPRGLDDTLSQGIISNANRVIGGLGYIQITAPISPGSSGGALLNDKGELIGITSAGITDAQNLNLAVPIHRYKELTSDILHPFPITGSTPEYSGAYVNFNTSMKVNVGGTGTLHISASPGNCTEEVYISFAIGNENIATAEWDDWNGWNVDLYVYGEAVGSTTITVGLFTESDDTMLASNTLYVTVSKPSYSGGYVNFNTNLSVNVGSTATVPMTTGVGNCTESMTIYFNVANPNIVSAAWASSTWDLKNISLNVTGKAAGSTTITISIIADDSGAVVATKTLYVTVTNVSRREVAYNKLAAWIIANSNTTINGKPAYEKYYYEGYNFDHYALIWNPNEDYITISVGNRYNGADSIAFFSIEEVDNKTIATISYYSSSSGSTPYFSGNANINIPTFSEDTTLTFYKSSGATWDAEVFADILKYMILDGLNYTNYIFYNYIGGGYSTADLGYISA